MKLQRSTQAPDETQSEHRSSSSAPLNNSQQGKEISETRRSPLRLLIVTIVAIFLAEVVAMIGVYLIDPLPYYQVTLIDAGIMVILIFPVLYYSSFRPLLHHIEKSHQAEGRLRRVNRTLTVLNECNQILVHAEQESEFLQQMCEILVNIGEYRMAWIGVAEHDEPHRVRPVARSGFEDGYLDSAEISWADNERGQGPTGTAIRQGIVQVNQNFLTNPNMAPWRESGLARGYQSSIALPLQNENSTIGALTIYSALPDAFDEEEVRLLKELSNDLAFGITALRVRAQRNLAEELNRQLSGIVEQTEDTVVVTNCDGVIEYVNPAFERLTGYPTEEVLGKTPRVLKSGIHDGPFYEQLWNTILKGEVFQSEVANRKKNGELFYEVKTITPLRDAQGNITHFVATGKDITEHKQDEEKLQKAYAALERRVQDRTEELRLVNTDLEEEVQTRRRTEEALRLSEFGLKRAQEIAHLGNWELDLEKNQLTWSDEVYRIFGLQPQEFHATYEAFLEAVHPDDRDAVDNAYSFSVSDGKNGYEIEHRVIRQRTGEVRIVHEKCEHLKNEAGQIVRSIGMVHDITERKQAEEALRRSEALLLQTGQMAKVGGWALDLQTMTPYWSLETYRIHEVDPSLQPDLDEAINFYTPEARPQITEAVRRALYEGQPYDLELQLVTAKGHQIWIRTIGEPEFQSGKCLRLVGTIQDITERKQAEQALRAAHDELELRVQERTRELATANRDLLNEIAERKEIERQLRIQTTAMEAAGSGIVITDRHGMIQWVNPAMTSISGYDGPELVGENMRIFSSGQHHEEYYRQLWSKILAGQVWRGETINRREDGTIYIEEQTITPVQSEHGVITHFIAIKQDITERKQAEEALRASEEKFRTLVEWTYDWEIWLDPAGTIIYNSPSCERISGYQPEEFQSTPELMTRIVHPDDRPAYLTHQNLLHNASAAAERIEYRILARDGKERWIEHLCRPLFGADSRYLGRRISKRDITEQKQAERDLQERNQKEKILTQTIHTLQLDIARDLHDTLGQNISFLRMKLDYLAEKKAAKKAEMQIELKGMARAADESYDLMRGTLAILQSADSTDLYRLFTRYAAQIEERSSFKLDFSTQGEPRFFSAKRMRQLFYIFREILSNAEKHAAASQVTLEMLWRPTDLRLVVCDNGKGFDLDQIQPGTHYGLRFMRERAELLNGSLTIASAPGSGTRIEIQIPYEQA